MNDMNYTELLDFAKANEIDIPKLAIANEVECVLFDYEEDFERLCELIYTMWLKTDLISLNSLCNATLNFMKRSGKRPNDIEFYESDWDTIIDDACYL